MPTPALRALRTIRSMWVVFGAICLIAASCSAGGVWYVARQPPAMLLAMQEDDGLAVRNGALELAVTIVRSRFCTVRVERWLWQDSGRVDGQGRMIRRYVTLPYAVAPPTPIGEPTSYVLSIPLPPNVTPGRWFYWARGVDECGWLPFLDRPFRASPNSPVTVTAAGMGFAPAAVEQLLTEPATP